MPSLETACVSQCCCYCSVALTSQSAFHRQSSQLFSLINRSSLLPYLPSDTCCSLHFAKLIACKVDLWKSRNALMFMWIPCLSQQMFLVPLRKMACVISHFCNTCWVLSMQTQKSALASLMFYWLIVCWMLFVWIKELFCVLTSVLPSSLWHYIFIAQMCCKFFCVVGIYAQHVFSTGKYTKPHYKCFLNYVYYISCT